MFKLLSNAVDTATVTEAVTEVAAEAQKGLQFHTSDIGEALLCSVAGMVGIFIVVGIIIFVKLHFSKHSSTNFVTVFGIIPPHFLASSFYYIFLIIPYTFYNLALYSL